MSWSRILRAGGLWLVFWHAAAFAAGSASAPGNPASTPIPPPTLTLPRVLERLALLRSGEAALSRLDTEAAQADFDRAALIAHSADTELGLVRSYMQEGEYRRALAFGAHTAGAHLDESRGTALYVWLLHAGGQGVIARKFLTDAMLRRPGQPLLAQLVAQLDSRQPLADGMLLQPPGRLAPYGSSAGLPATARTVGSAVLIDQGRRALVPIGTVSANARTRGIWLRNGMGQLARAQVERQLPDLGVAVLRLDQPLPPGRGLSLAARDAFPGSVAFAVEYVPGASAQPRWPLLSSGFVGAAVGGPERRQLGIDLPVGPRGGPVFDNAGRFVGMAMARVKTGVDGLALASRLQAALAGTANGAGHSLGEVESAGAAPRLPMDDIYEQSLRSTLQVILGR